ncbi:STAT, all-alpha domain protein [Escherichia coli]|nr:STAT, all-alpha domain protein [Escherichia coli]
MKMQNVFLTVKNFKSEEKINQEKYIEKPANVAHEIASFFDIEQYLLGVIDRNNNYINENSTYKLQDLANLSGARDAQLERKVYFDTKMLNLNDNDEKEKVKIENDIKKIDKKIEEIDNAIWDLSSETERFKIKFQQENRLNDVILGISRWLKENQVMVETIKKIDTE